MRILVLGGTGFVGRHVVRRLSDDGHEVSVFHRGETQAPLPDGVREILGDRKSLEEPTERLIEGRPDVVVDIVPYVEEDARSIVTLFRGRTRRVVAISSQDVYRAYGILIGTERRNVEPPPLAEESPLRNNLYPYRGTVPRKADDPLNWRDDYEKILVERVYLEAADLLATVLRLPALYGPGDPHHRTFEFLKRMDDGREVIFLSTEVARWRWTRGYVEDVASAIVLAATHDSDENHVYNVGEPQAPTVHEWVERIAKAANWHGRIELLPNERLPVHLRVQLNTDQELVSDSSRIRNELGYAEEVSLDDAFQRTVVWQRQSRCEFDPKLFDYAAEDALLRRNGPSLQ